MFFDKIRVGEVERGVLDGDNCAADFLLSAILMRIHPKLIICQKWYAKKQIATANGIPLFDPENSCL
jgi:hypothetical protein